MTTASGSRHGREPAPSVRRVLTPERALAGRPEAVAGAGRLDRPARRARVAGAAAAPPGREPPAVVPLRRRGRERPSPNRGAV
ncbi:hypothetical protein Srubr_41820 [Streptomyces rubradiris]|uniref:Uncharacterized protein n=1 Tax=Streptomyces rubradiris TaxID=285531 RepID=A0ABQ3RET5_STRRR|nr:hypothetical protein Srubr_41820 [Streptomyces rubradiris]